MYLYKNLRMLLIFFYKYQFIRLFLLKLVYMSGNFKIIHVKLLNLSIDNVSHVDLL